MYAPFSCTEKDSGLRDRYVDVIASAPSGMSSQLVLITFEDSSLWLSFSRGDQVKFGYGCVMV